MAAKYPVKKLSILNLLFAFTSALFIFAFVIVLWGTKGFHDAVSGSLLTLILLALTGLGNIMLSSLFKKQLTVQSPGSKKIYYTLTYVFTCLIFVLVVICDNQLNHETTNIIDIISLIVISIFVNTLVVIFHNYIVLQDAKINADMENSQLKAANVEASNQLLRQQIHPHFLFNALNILKSLYKIDPNSAEEYLICLSDFLRASVSNNNIKIVRLKDEIKLCQDYLRMQKIRFGNALICTVSIGELMLESGFVPSFSIQPLLENAIKHNELTEEFPLSINIKQDGERIIVSNSIRLKNIPEAYTGSGLANLSERYRILSNDEVQIKTNETTFSVSIKVLDHKVITQN